MRFLIIACLLAASPVMAEEYHPLPQEGQQPGGAVRLTRPDGTAIYVQPSSVAFIRGPLPGESGHSTIVFSSGAKQTVLETPDEIGKIMDVELKRND